MDNPGKRIGLTFLVGAFILFVFFSFNVFGKPLVVNANPTLQINNFSINVSIGPTCDLNYTDITLNISQKLFQAQSFPNGSRINAPRMMGDRYTLFTVSDNAVSFYYYYIYDSGADGQWLTNDDMVTYITNNSLSQGTPTGMPDLYGMISEDAGVTRFYWSVYKHLGSLNRGSHIYRCTLSNQGCVQYEFINYLSDRKPEIIGLVPLESQDRLFMVIEEDSFSPYPVGGSIYSCSLNSSNLDSCYSDYRYFIKHENYSAYIDNIKDKGFVYYESNPYATHSFFDASLQTSTLLPPNTLVNSYTAASLNNLFFTYRRYPQNASLVDFYLVDYSSGQGTILSTDISRITPLLAERDSSAIVVYVYDRLRPGIYQQFIKRLNGQITEVYRSSTNVNSPMPLTVTSDGFLIGTKATPSGVRFYKSNCSG